MRSVEIFTISVEHVTFDLKVVIHECVKITDPSGKFEESQHILKNDIILIRVGKGKFFHCQMGGKDTRNIQPTQNESGRGKVKVN